MGPHGLTVAYFIKVNILLATYSYYPYNWGGTEVYVSGLAAYLQQQGHQVTIIAAMPKRAFEEHPVFFEDSNLKAVTYSFDEVKVIGVLLKGSTTADIYSKFRKEWVQSWSTLLTSSERGKWDVLHLHANTAAIGHSLLKAARVHSDGIKIIASYHVPVSCVKGTLLFANSMRECAVKPSVNTCTACCISSQQNLPYQITAVATAAMPLLRFEKLPVALRIKYLVKQFIAAFTAFDEDIDLWHVFSDQINGILQLNGVKRKKICLVRHGVHPDFFESNQEMLEERKHQQKIIFLYAGRFDKVKGFTTLLKAWCSLPEIKERELWVVGDKQTNDAAIEKWMEVSSRRKDICWLGAKSQQELSRVMKKVHCTIIPSEWVEIGPLVFHEAIAAGSDVIASGIGGCKELAGLYYKKAGLFEPGNSAALSGSILNFKYSSISLSPLLQASNYQLVATSYSQLVAL